MKKQIQFEITDSTTALESTRTFFTAQGFTITNQTDTTITFSKGSVIQNLASFNPLKWKSTTDVSVSNNLLTADFAIDTTGQTVTAKEEKLWDTFIQKFRSAVANNTDVTQEISREVRAAQQGTWKYVLWALVGGFVVGVPFAFLAYLTGFKMLAPMGAAAGSILFMMNRINNDRKQNQNNP